MSCKQRFIVDNDDNDNENNEKKLIFVEEAKTTTKIETSDDNEIKINAIIVLTKISDTQFST